MGLEGLIAKNKDSKYIQGVRSKDWLKIKHIKTQDCVIIGYNSGEGNRQNYFGSLLLAAKNPEGKFQFIGHTGSGFNLNSLELIYNQIKKLKIEKCPIDFVPYTNRDTIWIKPQIVVEIKFNSWTRDKIMKSPIFERIRDDKLPKECSLEKESLTDNVLKIKKNIKGFH